MRPVLLSLAALCCVPPAAPAGEAKKDARPNVLILIADDWSWPHAGAYGDKVVRTPNIDKVAREGVLFRRAYCVAPSCTPSRAALLTGQWAHRLEEGGNLHGFLPQRFATFPDLLGRAGYFVGLVGKGWGPGNFAAGGRPRNPAGPNYKSFGAFLQALPPDRPFCFWFGSTDPHRPYEAGSGVKAGMKLEDVTVPPYWPDTQAVRSDILDYYFEVNRFDAQVGEVLRQLEESGRAENTIVLILSDNGMPFPRCKANLYECGTHMPMIARWPARVPAGGDTSAFVSYQDIAPTVLQAAGVEPPKDMTGRSFLDLLGGQEATGRDHVFVERERHANVRQGDLSYPARAIRTERYLYIRNFRPERWPAGDPQTYFAVGPYGDIDDGPTKQVILLMEKEKDAGKAKFFDLCCAKRPAEELYDCEADPHQVKNLAADPAHARAKAELKAKLRRWMEETGDPRAAAGGGDDRWDRFPYYGGPGKGVKVPGQKKKRATGAAPQAAAAPAERTATTARSALWARRDAAAPRIPQDRAAGRPKMHSDGTP